MQFRPDEVRTGLLVLATVTILTGVLFALGRPGLFKTTNTYNIYLDSAPGLAQGAPVVLDGQRVGQVTSIASAPDSPKPEERVLVKVMVLRTARVYSKVQVEMHQLSLLGQPVIDFSNGDKSSGLAANGSSFEAIRQKDSVASSTARAAIESVLTRFAQGLIKSPQSPANADK